jgi:hypothetical protein
MAQKTEMRACDNCEKMTLYISNPPNNLVHGLVSIFLAGMWIPIWLILLMVQKDPQCSSCGRSADAPTSKKFAKIVIYGFIALIIMIISFLAF